MKKSFSYMFQDNKFGAKVFVFFVYVLLMTFCSLFGFKSLSGKIELDLVNYLVIFFFSLFVISVVEGYRIANTKIINESSQIVLPNFNLKKNFLLGLKFQVSILMFFIPFGAIISAFGFAYGFSITISTLQHSFVPLIAGFLTTVAVILYIVYMISFLPASTLLFAKTNNIWSFYKFEEIFKIVNLNKKKYWSSVFLCCFVAIIGEELGRLILKSIGMPIFLFMVMLAIIAIVWVYLFFVSVYIVADLDKKNNLNTILNNYMS